MSAGMKVQAVYSVAEIARAARLPTRRMRWLLRTCQVEMFLVGRAWMVPLDDVREKIPALFRNLAVVHRLTVEKPP